MKDKLTKSGSNYEMLLKNHDQHYRNLEKTIELLYSFKINVKVIQRFNYTLDDIQWSDAILTAGGDGTFLLAAAKINNSTKPLFGINTDTEHSEGYLLLPHEQSKNFSVTLKKILNGQFKYFVVFNLKI